MMPMKSVHRPQRFNAVFWLTVVLAAYAPGAWAQTDTISVVSPQAGERYAVGDSMRIEWHADSGTNFTGQVIEITPDNGLTYATIKMVNRNTRSFLWVVTATAPSVTGLGDESVSLIGDSCWILVRDYEKRTLDGISGYFSIGGVSQGMQEPTPRPRRIGSPSQAAGPVFLAGSSWLTKQNGSHDLLGRPMDANDAQGGCRRRSAAVGILSGRARSK